MLTCVMRSIVDDHIERLVAERCCQSGDVASVDDSRFDCGGKGQRPASLVYVDTYDARAWRQKLMP